MTIVIIAGSRTIKDYDWLCRAIERSGYVITEVVSGKEPNGVDALGERWAAERNIPVAPYPADWDRFSLAAGPIRNTAMSEYADAAIILRAAAGQRSRGSDDMFSKMVNLHKPVYREFEGENHDG